MWIDIDAEKCSGCGICGLICSLSHEKEFNPKRARIKVMHWERIGLSIPTTCNQCKECIATCPEDAISWDEAMEIVRVDADKCTSCGLCVDVCDLQAIHLDPVTGAALICDLCDGEPQCVEWCPTGALRYEAKGIPVAQRSGKDYVQNQAKAIAAKWGVPLGE